MVSGFSLIVSCIDCGNPICHLYKLDCNTTLTYSVKCDAKTRMALIGVASQHGIDCEECDFDDDDFDDDDFDDEDFDDEGEQDA